MQTIQTSLFALRNSAGLLYAVKNNGVPENDNGETVEDPIVKYIPEQRRGSSEDVIPLVMFLASEASSYLSGNVYTVDGGLMARG